MKEVIYNGKITTFHKCGKLVPGVNRLSNEIADHLISTGVVQPKKEKKKIIDESINKKNKKSTNISDKKIQI